MQAPRSSGAIAVAALALLFAACGGRDTGDTDTAAAATDTVPTAALETGPPAGTATFLDPNAASVEQLQAVPGMTPAAAQALVAGRPYADMVAVDRALAAQLPDTAARKAIYAQVWRPIDLNTAKAEEILLIPGVGPRMRREFEEYRPYPDMAKFRREIGKYVDEQEVARLERYVVIR